ncbi:MAG: sulfur oxidation c-type cytochrome SoxX [Rhodospirillales bacterium]
MYRPILSGILALGIGMAVAGGPAWAADEPMKLVAYKVTDDTAIKKSLTGNKGDAEKGKAVFVNRKQGNCLACHALTELSDQPFHGEVAPSLDGVAGRYSEGELRLRVVNPKVINADTMMPAFYRVDGLTMVSKNFAGKPILTAEQVEDLVAYLTTLK